MKTAIANPVAAEVYCPACDMGVASPRGSYIWYKSDARSARRRKYIECHDCFVRSKVPAALLMLADA